MTVRKVDEPAEQVPAGYKGYYLVGPPAEVRQAIETTANLEWFSRPQPYGSEVLVRVRQRIQLRAQPARQALPAPAWWRDPRKVTIAGFAGGGVLTALGVTVWLLVLLVSAVVSWLSANWALVVAILVVAFIGFFALTRVGRGSTSGGAVISSGCPGIHCRGCRDH